jgi:hypothetical protein
MAGKEAFALTNKGFLVLTKFIFSEANISSIIGIG